MSKFSDSQYQAALDVILARAASDSAFRARALEDAPAAIKEATSLDMPEGVTVRFVEFGQAAFSDGSNYVIPLPPGSSEDLADSELLDSVAGGRNSYNTSPPVPPDGGDFGGERAPKRGLY